MKKTFSRVFLSSIVLCFNIHMLFAQSWTERMVDDYLQRNNHYDQSYAASIEAFLSEILSSTYVMPDGSSNYYTLYSNRTAADWFYVLRFNGNLASRTVTKSGAIIKWQLDNVIYNQNNLPVHTLGSGQGWLLMTSSDGWTGITEINLNYNPFTGNLPKFIMQNVTYPQFNDCSYTGIIPDMEMKADRYRFEDNAFTGIENGVRSILGTNPYEVNLQNNNIDAHSLDSVMLGIYNYYSVHTPTKDVTIQFQGGTNEGLLHEYYNYNWYRLNSIFTTYNLTVYRNDYTGAYNLSDATYAGIRYQIRLDDENKSATFRNVIFKDYIDLQEFAQVIYIDGANKVTIENCSFENIRRNSGGDLHALNISQNIDSLIIKNCIFNNISADGIQIGRTIYEDTINNYINYVLIDSCTFINPANTSTENGIDWKGGCTDKGIIQNCSFRGYKYCNPSQGCTGADGEAIAIHYRLSRNLIIRNNTITDCNVGIAVAKGSAGGDPLMEYAPRNLQVTNNLINCEEMGIQAWNVEDITMQNNIIYDGMYGLWISDLKNMKLNNNTIVNCYEAPLIEYITSIGTIEYTNNLIAGENEGVWMDIPGSNNLLIEDISTVHFANTASKDYHLTAASEIAIGKGFNNGLTYDFDGETRLNDGLIDIGADEYWPGGSEPENIAPTANAGADQRVTDSDLNGSQPVTLNGSGSSDSDGSIAIYSWRENSTQIATGVSPTVNLTVGTHTIQLVVTDNDGATGTDNVTITVNAGTVPNNAPTANAGTDQSVTDSDLNGSQPVTLNGSGSSDSDGSIAIYSWRENSTQIATGVSPTVNLTVGIHTVQLVVTDDDGATASDYVTINIIEGAPLNNPPSISDQVFNVYETDSINQFIGLISASDPDPLQSLTFSILSGNNDNFFTLKDDDGGLYITYPVSEINFDSLTSRILVVQVMDDGKGNLKDQANINIDFFGNILYSYIDPGNSSDPNRNGTYDHPYALWNEINWNDNMNYLQKRGTVIELTDPVFVAASNITIGAYGEGEDPKISNTTTENVFEIYNKTSITFENLSFTGSNAISILNFINGDSSNLSIEKCIFTGSDYGVRTNKGKYASISKCTFENTISGVVLLTEFADINYCNFIGQEIALDIQKTIGETRVFNNVFDNNRISIEALNETKSAICNNIFYLELEGDIAIHHSANNIVSDYNLFYPEQTGFIVIDDYTYSTLYVYQHALNQDSHSFVGDPLFIDPLQKNYEVKDNSPVINAGLNVGLVEDIYGAEVPYGSATDIGSHEKQYFVYHDDYIEEQTNSILVYPNPSDGYLIIVNSSLNNSISGIELYNYTGQRFLIDRSRIYSTAESGIMIDLHDLPAGLYFIRIQPSDKINTIKTVFIQ